MGAPASAGGFWSPNDALICTLSLFRAEPVPTDVLEPAEAEGGFSEGAALLPHLLRACNGNGDQFLSHHSEGGDDSVTPELCRRDSLPAILL